MEALIILAFVLLVGFFFVLLSRLQRRSSGHTHDVNCNHDHSQCGHEHSDASDGGSRGKRQ